jgi:hypothetical protein|tara:strand:- start:205 stop:573 length:369 start_codon:yes stop_codon:yes gene_type:complete
MANITMNFSFPINVSVQVGDIAYYTKNTTSLGTHIHSDQGDIIQIGEITIVNRIANTIVCLWDPDPAIALPPSSDDFIMFSKDNKANLSNVLGYYAEVKFVNNSPDEAELFSVGSEIYGSSK